MAYLDKTGLARFYDGMKSRFLLKSAVANDLTVTAAGYVLDARQGKALADLANGKASKTTATASLAVASWSGSGPYTQTVSVSGVTAGNAVVVTPAPASFKAGANAGCTPARRRKGS